MCFIYITLLTLIDHLYSIESVNCLILFHGNCRPRAFCCTAVLLYGSTIYTLVVMGYQDFQIVSTNLRFSHAAKILKRSTNLVLHLQFTNLSKNLVMFTLASKFTCDDLDYELIIIYVIFI